MNKLTKLILILSGVGIPIVIADTLGHREEKPSVNLWCPYCRQYFYTSPEHYRMHVALHMRR
jgi:hypothetical protein